MIPSAFAPLLGLALAAEPTERQLGPHDFGQPVAVEPVFLAPYASFRQGAGLLTLRSVGIPGVPQPLTFRMLGLTEVVRGQARLHQRIAVGAYASGAVLTGADTDSALFVGASAAYELRLDGRVQVLRTGGFQLTGQVGGRRSYERSVTPADLAIKILDNTERSLVKVLRGRWASAVLTTRRSWQGLTGLSMAASLSQTAGLLASVTTRAGTVRFDDNQARGSDLQVLSGAALDLRIGEQGWGLQFGVENRLDRLYGLADEVPGTQRLVFPVEVYLDRGGYQLGVVPQQWVVWGGGATQRHLGLEARAVGYF